MKFILTIAVIFSLAWIEKQADSWKVYQNKKLYLHATAEDEQKNIIRISKKSLAGKGRWLITYRESSPNSAWKRYFSIEYPNGENRYLSDGPKSISISNAKLKNLFGSQSILKIYSWSLPKDQAQAALIRIRRVHLCTLQLQ